jgi:hypothetical protein
MNHSSGGGKVVLRAVACFLVVASVAAAERQESFLTGINPKDGKALLEAGSKLEAEGKASWALQCYRRVLKLGDGPARPEATFRAGRIELARKSYEEAYGLLREAARHDHAGAREILEKAETTETRKQMDLLLAARKNMEGGKYAAARKQYDDAYKLYPGKPTAAPFAPRNEVLLEMAKCVDLIDDDYYREKVQSLEAGIKNCKKCETTGGFISCDACKGKGKVRKLVTTGLQRGFVDVPCSACRMAPGESGTGWVFCPAPCYGLQAYPTDKKIGERERKAILDVVNKVRSVKTLSGSLASVLDSIENTLLAVEESASLDYLRAMKPGYSFSREIKDGLGAAPPDEKALARAVPAWKSAGRDARIRANFLLSYVIEFAQWLKPFEMLRAPKKKVDFKSPPVASAMASRAAAPEILSADPEDMTSGWLAVEGTFEGYEEGGGDSTKGILKVTGNVKHNVRFFIWLPAASNGIQWLEKSFWYPRLGGITKAYPFDIRARASVIPRGHKVVLAGRFLRDRLGFPRNWFEVWDIHVGLSRDGEEVLLALKDPVTVLDFRGVKALELAGFLKVLHGIDLEWGSVDRNSLLDVTADGCPVGLAIDAMAKALGASWRFEKGAVVLGGPPQDMEPVLAALSALNKGSVNVSRSEAGAVASRPAKLPDSPRALAEMAQRALGEMDYGLSLECHDKLLAAAAEGAETDKLARAREKVRLFHELTRRTPVSSLVGAKDLVRLKIKNKAGDTSEQTVRVLERTPGIIKFRPSYGGTVGVKPEDVVGETRISGDEWRAEKRRDLEERSRKLDRSEPREKVNELFILGLFAKTYDFRDQGTALLEKAAASDEFDWLLGTYFPGARRDLAAAWRRATGRDARPAPIVEPADPSAKQPGAPRLKADEPIPDDPGQLLAFAKKHMDQGRSYFAQSLPGMDGAKDRILLARAHLEKARDALDKLAPGRSGDQAVIRLRQDVSQGLQDCVKCLGFFDG